MSDLISRQAAVDVAQKTIENPRVLDRVMLKLYELPSAQPEQKKGKWVLKTLDDGNGEFQLYECSSCGIYTPSRRPFCCNCGAKML